MRKKFADCVRKMSGVLDVESKIKPVNETEFVGDIYLNNFKQITKPFLLDNGLCILDKDYKWLEFYLVRGFFQN